MARTDCEKCKGSGRYYDDSELPCPACGGRGWVRDD